jgi:hypothetical protein
MKLAVGLSRAILACSVGLPTTGYQHTNADHASTVPAVAAPSAKVETAGAPHFVGGYPTTEASTQLYDEMDYQRAVPAYIWGTPLVHSVGIQRAFATGCCGVPAQGVALLGQRLRALPSPTRSLRNVDSASIDALQWPCYTRGCQAPGRRIPALHCSTQRRGGVNG